MQLGQPPSDHGIIVTTFQSFASDLLRRHGPEVLGIRPYFSIWDREMAVNTAHEIVTGERRLPRGVTRVVGSFPDWDADARNARVSPPIPPDPQWFQFAATFAGEKRLQNVVDHDDLILLAIKVLEVSPTIRTAYNQTTTRHLLVDNFEDINIAQFHLLKLLMGPTRSITVTVDPNQRVKSGRHADPNVAELFKLEFPEAAIRRLSLDHVASGNLAQLAADLTHSSDLMGLTPARHHAFMPPGPAVVPFYRIGTPHQLCSAVGGEITDLARDASLTSNDVACIYRNHTSGQRMATQLEIKHIPYTIVGDSIPEMDQFVRPVMALVTLAANPYDARAFRAGAHTNSRHETAGTILTHTTPYAPSPRTKEST